MIPPLSYVFSSKNSLSLNSSSMEVLLPFIRILVIVRSDPVMILAIEIIKKCIYLKLALVKTKNDKVTVNIREVFRFLVAWLLRFFYMIGFILISLGLKNIIAFNMNFSRVDTTVYAIMIIPTIKSTRSRFIKNENNLKSLLRKALGI